MTDVLNFVLEKNFAVSSDVLFQAFLDEAVLTEIWGVQSLTIKSRKVGGQAIARYMVGPDDWSFTLTYTELKPNESLGWAVQFSGFPDKEIKASLRFQVAAKGCQLRVCLEQFATPQERDANAKAWQKALTILENIFIIH